MKRILFLSILMAIFVSAKSQTPGPFYRQFLFNPYLFNPAYVAINDQAELNLVYRKQWVNFKDAPTTTGISFQYPTARRVSLGLNITSDEQVLLTNNTFMGTFGYTIPISNYETIRFGISAGLGMNKLDLTEDEINLNDPAVLRAANNSTYVDGNFGVVYTYKTLRLGFAFTEIFKSDPFDKESFSKFSLSNLRNRVYSASYRFPIDLMENFAIEPYVVYRQSEDKLQDSWEIASMVHYKDVLWTGATYNQNKGVGLLFGMNVLNKFSFSYSYEFPPFNSDISSTNSHEFHLGMRFGDKKSRLAKGPVKNSPSYQKMNQATATAKKTVEKEETSAEDEQVSESYANNEQPETISSQGETNLEAAEIKESKITDVEETIETTNARPPKSFTLSKGHYVVVGAFSVLNYANRYSQVVKAKGYAANVALNPAKRLYYVYIFSSYDIDEARKIRNQYRLKNLFQEAWLHSVE